MYLEVRKTYKGRTAGGWMKLARIAECQAGNWEVTIDHPDFEGTIVHLSDYGRMVFNTADQRFDFCLEMSDRARSQLEKLLAARDKIKTD